MKYINTGIFQRCILLLLLGLTACTEQPGSQLQDKPNIEVNTHKPVINPLPTQVLPSAFIDRAGQHIIQFHQHTQQLNRTIDTFLNTNDTEHWQALQQQWINTHNSWHLCEFYFALMREQKQQYTALLSFVEQIHSTPIMAGYLDGIAGYPYSGIVNDTTVAITRQSIMAQHQRYDSAEVAVGLHALEFFIWGRSVSDYNKPSADKPLNDSAQALPNHQQSLLRRRQYLVLLGQLLVETAGQLVDSWSQIKQNTSDQEHYLKAVVAQSIVAQLQRIAPHSEFLHTGAAATPAWQTQIITEWQYWLQQLPPSVLAQQTITELTDEMDSLLTLLSVQEIDNTELDRQRLRIIDRLGAVSALAADD